MHLSLSLYHIMIWCWCPLELTDPLRQYYVHILLSCVLDHLSSTVVTTKNTSIPLHRFRYIKFLIVLWCLYQVSKGGCTNSLAHTYIYTYTDTCIHTIHAYVQYMHIYMLAYITHHICRWIHAYGEQLVEHFPCNT